MIAFIVPGFGMTDDFVNDPNYSGYLKKVADTIGEYRQSRPEEKMVIVFSGGPSDLDPPYERTEAEEMKKAFAVLADQDLSNIDIRTETQSLSSLDNLLYSKEILDQIGSEIERIVVFSEETRERRTRVTAERIFSQPIETIPLQLYTEEQMEDAELMAKKEEVALKYSLWALENPENLVKSRQAYAQKFKMMRQAPPEQREEAQRRWWQQMIELAKSQAVFEREA